LRREGKISGDASGNTLRIYDQALSGIVSSERTGGRHAVSQNGQMSVSRRALSVKKRLGHPGRRSENRIDQFSSTRLVWAVRQGGWDQVVVVVVMVEAVVVVVVVVLRRAIICCQKRMGGGVASGEEVKTSGRWRA
jgi:hypothetical protein